VRVDTHSPQLALLLLVRADGRGAAQSDGLQYGAESHEGQRGFVRGIGLVTRSRSSSRGPHSPVCAYLCGERSVCM